MLTRPLASGPTGPGSPLSPRAKETLRKAIAYIEQRGQGMTPIPADGRTLDLGGGRSPRLGGVVDATADQELRADITGERPAPTRIAPGARVPDLPRGGPMRSGAGAGASGGGASGTALQNMGEGDVVATAEGPAGYSDMRVDTSSRQRPTAPSSKLTDWMRLAGALAQVGGAVAGGDVGTGIASAGAGLASGATVAASEEEQLFRLEQQAYDEWLSDADRWNRQVGLAQVGAEQQDRRRAEDRMMDLEDRGYAERLRAAEATRAQTAQRLEAAVAMGQASQHVDDVMAVLGMDEEQAVRFAAEADVEAELARRGEVADAEAKEQLVQYRVEQTRNMRARTVTEGERARTERERQQSERTGQDADRALAEERRAGARLDDRTDPNRSRSREREEDPYQAALDMSDAGREREIERLEQLDRQGGLDTKMRNRLRHLYWARHMHKSGDTMRAKTAPGGTVAPAVDNIVRAVRDADPADADAKMVRLFDNLDVRVDSGELTRPEADAIEEAVLERLSN